MIKMLILKVKRFEVIRFIRVMIWERHLRTVRLRILAISDNVQEMVDCLVALGIKGIVDFTHSHFIVPQGVEVQNVDVVVAIQELELKMKSNTKE